MCLEAHVPGRSSNKNIGLISVLDLHSASNIHSPPSVLRGGHTGEMLRWCLGACDPSNLVLACGWAVWVPHKEHGLVGWRKRGLTRPESGRIQKPVATARKGPLGAQGSLSISWGLTRTVVCPYWRAEQGFGSLIFPSSPGVAGYTEES